ncbi:MAG: hypothetical protein PUB39_00390 [Eubacteriales bacterium]|nr:hypothetical protein [Eubacteriales bacterium]
MAERGASLAMFDKIKKRYEEVTVYTSKNDAEYEAVKYALDYNNVKYRDWTTEEAPVFLAGWPFDPRLLARGETRLRKIHHIDVDLDHVASANAIIRRILSERR